MDARKRVSDIAQCGRSSMGARQATIDEPRRLQARVRRRAAGPTTRSVARRRPRGGSQGLTPRPPPRFRVWPPVMAPAWIRPKAALDRNQRAQMSNDERRISNGELRRACCHLGFTRYSTFDIRYSIPNMRARSAHVVTVDSNCARSCPRRRPRPSWASSSRNRGRGRERGRRRRAAPRHNWGPYSQVPSGLTHGSTGL